MAGVVHDSKCEAEYIAGAEGYTPCLCAQREEAGLVINFTGPGRMPTKAYEEDAGFDLYTCGVYEVDRHEFQDIPCGVAVELPPGTWALITGRSSSIRNGLIVVNSIIDQGWRGELSVAVYALRRRMIYEGERIGQLIPMMNVGRRWTLRKVDKLNETARGTNGFGSTGR